MHSIILTQIILRSGMRFKKKEEGSRATLTGAPSRVAKQILCEDFSWPVRHGIWAGFDDIPHLLPKRPGLERPRVGRAARLRAALAACWQRRGPPAPCHDIAAACRSSTAAAGAADGLCPAKTNRAGRQPSAGTPTRSRPATHRRPSPAGTIVPPHRTGPTRGRGAWQLVPLPIHVWARGACWA
jgi:hypothetical protein